MKPEDGNNEALYIVHLSIHYIHPHIYTASRCSFVQELVSCQATKPSANHESSLHRSHSPMTQRTASIAMARSFIPYFFYYFCMLYQQWLFFLHTTHIRQRFHTSLGASCCLPECRRGRMFRPCIHTHRTGSLNGLVGPQPGTHHLKKIKGQVQLHNLQRCPAYATEYTVIKCANGSTLRILFLVCATGCVSGEHELKLNAESSWSFLFRPRGSVIYAWVCVCNYVGYLFMQLLIGLCAFMSLFLSLSVSSYGHSANTKPLQGRYKY